MTQSTPTQNEEPQTNPNKPQTWQPKKKSPLKKLLVLGLLLSGVMGILYAYQLPPFSPNHIETNNAYIRGKATVISPKVGGYVKEILVQDYEWVEAGQPLVQIETEQYEMKVAQASAGVLAQETALQKIKQAQTSAVANIAVMDANISSAQATLANAQAQFGRMAELIKIDAVSRQAYDDAQTNVKKAQLALAQAIAQKKASEQQAIDVKVNEKSNLVAIDNAKAGLELAKLDLEQTLIKSPISGQLGEITAKTGQLVAVGTNLMTVVPPDYWLIANVKETEIAQIGIGSLAHIEVDALGGKTILTGKVTQIAPATGSEFSTAKTDPSTGNFIKIAQRIPVKIEFDPNQSAVKNVSMGMSAVVKIDKVNEVAVK